MSKVIYFDSASKTIPYEEVISTYVEIQKAFFANPSSIHFEGVKALRYLDLCREKILNNLKVKNRDVVFTSSATESNNLAIKGFALKYKNRGKHIISTIYEHESVKEALKQLEDEYGFKVTYLVPDSNGVISVDDVLKNITNETILISIMAVNNEIGSVNDIAAIGKELINYPKLCFHVDAAQAIGKVDIDYSNVDLLTISAHKIHGLVGSACLIIKKNLNLLPLLSGGGQELGLRSSTIDIANVAAFTYAFERSIKERNRHYETIKPLADKLLNYLNEHKDIYHVNSSGINPYVINFSTITKKGSVVVEALSRIGIMVSSTSACSSNKEKGSYVVASICNNPNVYNNTIRVSLSYLNNEEEMKEFIKSLDLIIKEIR